MDFVVGWTLKKKNKPCPCSATSFHPPALTLPQIYPIADTRATPRSDSPTSVTLHQPDN